MIQSGIDQFIENKLHLLEGKRVGVLVHAVSMNSQGIHLLDFLSSQPYIQFTQIFTPEHGLWGVAQDMEEVKSSIDPKTKLPIKSLYGNTFESLTPTTEDLASIDVLVCDLQDIGTRYYTYAATMALCMQACAKDKKEVIVLDRPNPINGIDLEGPLLKKGFESFVGLYPIPVRHGMTLGELALYYNQKENIGCRLEVVKMEGWKREDYFDQTGLRWLRPSPNMPNINTALVYPGMCLLEATNLSEGRGTSHPFETLGAPFIRADSFGEALAKLELPGINFEPITFRPSFQKWANQNCEGVRLQVTDRKTFKPYLTGIAVLKTVMDLYSQDFAWRDKPYEFVSDIPAIDLLSGDDTLRKKLESNCSLEEIQANWTDGLDFFLEKRGGFLLY